MRIIPARWTGQQNELTEKNNSTIENVVLAHKVSNQFWVSCIFSFINCFAMTRTIEFSSSFKMASSKFKGRFWGERPDIFQVMHQFQSIINMGLLQFYEPSDPSKNLAKPFESVHEWKAEFWSFQRWNEFILMGCKKVFDSKCIRKFIKTFLLEFCTPYLLFILLYSHRAKNSEDEAFQRYKHLFESTYIVCTVFP